MITLLRQTGSFKGSEPLVNPLRTRFVWIKLLGNRVEKLVQKKKGSINLTKLVNFGVNHLSYNIVFTAIIF